MKRTIRTAKNIVNLYSKCVIAVSVFTAIIFFSAPDSNYSRYLKAFNMTELICFILIVSTIPIIAKMLLRQILWSMKLNRYKHSSLSQIDHMTGKEFEEFLCVVFKNKGYRVKHVGQTGDFGADLICHKDGKKLIVQAKRYKSNVGVKAVQEVIAAVSYYDGDEGMVVTNSHFTKAAKELAGKSNITLWDREYIGRNIRRQ